MTATTVGPSQGALLFGSLFFLIGNVFNSFVFMPQMTSTPLTEEAAKAILLGVFTHLIGPALQPVSSLLPLILCICSSVAVAHTTKNLIGCMYVAWLCNGGARLYLMGSTHPTLLRKMRTKTYIDRLAVNSFVMSELGEMHISPKGVGHCIRRGLKLTIYPVLLAAGLFVILHSEAMGGVVYRAREVLYNEAVLNFSLSWEYMLVCVLFAIQMNCFMHFLDGCNQLAVALFGVEVQLNMDHPAVHSESLQELWGNRWNRYVNTTLRFSVFEPLKRTLGVPVTSFFVFAASGAFHMWLGYPGIKEEYMVTDLASIMVYFLCCWFIITVEVGLGVKRTAGPSTLPAWMKRTLTLTQCAILSPLITGPMLRNTVLWKP